MSTPSPRQGVTRGILDAAAMVDVLPVAAMLVGLDDLVLACNAAAEALLGMPPRQAVGRPFHEVATASGLSGLRVGVEQAKRSAPDQPPRELPVSLSSEGRELVVTVAPARDIDGHLGAVLVILVDRSAALAAEQEQTLTMTELETENVSMRQELDTSSEELRVSNETLRLRIEQLEMAEHADEQKNVFLAMLAHELRNPLGPIASALYIIRQRASGDRAVAQAVEIADRQVRQQARLLDDLLDVSRIVLGKVELRLEAVDLAVIARQAVEAARLLAQTRAHRLEVVVPDTPVVVSGDAARLEQVIRNLLDNAVKYTPPGGHIELVIERNSSQAVVRVTDSGIGIEAAMQPKIFDLFMQAESSLARSQGGLGIGLTLVRRLVERHEGHVAVHSEGRGHGSTFTITLRLAQDQTVAAAPAPIALAPKARRMLIVEDSRDARALLRVVLEMDGHVVMEAGDGESGVRLAVQWAPDIVLIDIGLPELDGYAVAREIRRRLGSSIRLVALTGYGGDDARRRSEAAGFDLHLVKPIGPRELARLLASV